MSDPAPILAIALFSLLGGMVAAWLGARERVLVPTLVSFAGHWAVAAAMMFTVGLWAPDAMHYDRLGVALNEYWFGGSPHEPFITVGKEGLPAMLAVIYALFGHLPFLGILVNVTAATLVVPIVASTCRVLQLPVRTSAWLAAVAPPLLLWGSLLLREAISWLLLAIIARGVAALVTARGNPLANWALALAPLLPLLAIRGTAALLVAAGVVAAYALTARNRTTAMVVGSLAAIAAAPALLAAGTSIVGDYDLDAVNRQRAALSRSASSAFEVEQVTGVGSVLASLPVSTARGLVGPFPWEVPSLGAFIALDAVMWWALAAMCLIGWWVSNERRALFAIMIPALLLLVVLSVTSGNYGTMMRLRYQTAIMVLPLAGAGLSWLMTHRRELFSRLVGRRAVSVPGLR